MRTLYKSLIAAMSGIALSVSAVAQQNLPGTKMTINVNGKNRTIDVYAPEIFCDNRPMVISAHGMNQDIAYQKEKTLWYQVADTANFLVVYPASDGSTWDLGGNGSDIQFIKAIIKEMSAKYKIDTNRVYMSGFSMGGMLTYIVANNMADQIAACGPCSGYPIGDKTAKPSRPMPIFHTNGDADDVVHYQAGTYVFNDMTQNQQGAYAQAESFAKANGCDDKPEEIYIAESKTTQYRWKNGKCGVEVWLNKVEGKGHWPFNDQFYTVREMWKFFRNYSLECGKDPVKPCVTEEQEPYNGTPAAIPGKIEAEEYDKGGQNVAYYDADKEQHGGAFRNDWVDVYESKTTPGMFTVGYNEKGEWLKYTVDVKETSKYKVTFSVATDNDNASFQLYLDGKAITGDISAANTGDFTTFTNVTARTKEELSAGKHELELRITNSWFDIDYMIFEKYEQTTSAEPYDDNGCVVGDRSNEDLAEIFSTIRLSNVNPTVKPTTNHNPIMTQRYGADPCAMVYGDSVYIYMTHDIYEYDNNGKIKDNGYGKITEIVCLASADLVNWTDHGPMKVAGTGGTTKAVNSWAPTACHAKINGKDRFFLYFANNGNGIYVAASDTPYGPWEDVKNGQGLITRSTPNCGNVTWLFDPAVLVDDDGTGYLYFGGGVPDGKQADPGTARIAKLGKDFISIDGTPTTLNPPYLFEDAGINKIGNNYVYSYCTNWNTGGNNIGISNAVISTMLSTNPMTGFKYDRKVFDNPSKWLGSNGNNHHGFFKFKGKWYICYHSQWMQNQIGVSGGYRITHVDYADVDESAGRINGVTAGTTKGVDQVGNVTKVENIQAECFAWQNGVSVDYIGRSTNMAVSGKDGSWIGVSQVEPGGVNTFRARVASKCGGAIRVTVDSPSGKAVAYLNVTSTGSDNEFEEFEVKTMEDLYMPHDYFFTFSGDLKFDSWGMYMKDYADVDGVSAKSGMVVEPNPASDMVSVHGVEAGEMISIYSPDGALLMQKVADSNDVRFDISSLNRGVVIVKAGSEAKRLIIK